MLTKDEYKECIRNFLKKHYIHQIININEYMHECNKMKYLYKLFHCSLGEELKRSKKYFCTHHSDSYFRGINTRIKIIGR